MKFLVFSDTHGSLWRAENVLRAIGEKMDGVFHLGDCVEDAQELERQFPKLPFTFVRGNNDFEPIAGEKLLHQQNRTILLTHGHRLNVSYGMDRLYYHALEHGADVALFGHTHHPHLEQAGGVLLMNPGSISLPRGGLPAFGILMMEHGRVEGAIMEYWGEKDFRRMDVVR